MKSVERFARRVLGRPVPRLFSAPVESWEVAVSASLGYQERNLVARSVDAAGTVQQGFAAFERDGVLFQHLDLDLPTLSALALSELRHKRTMAVVDVGGGLASNYLRHKSVLHRLGVSSWTIVETPAMVRAGKKLCPERGLSFIDDLEVALSGSPTTVMFGSSLQYLDKPFVALRQVHESTSQVVLVDRIPVWRRSQTLPVVQRTPDGTQPGSYPCWLFSEQQLLRGMGEDWTLMSAYDSVGGVWETEDGERVSWRGYLFVRDSFGNSNRAAF